MTLLRILPLDLKFMSNRSFSFNNFLSKKKKILLNIITGQDLEILMSCIYSHQILNFTVSSLQPKKPDFLLSN